MQTLPEDKIENLKKFNRIKKLAPKTHKIEKVAGGSLKGLWAQLNKKKNNA